MRKKPGVNRCIDGSVTCIPIHRRRPKLVGTSKCARRSRPFLHSGQEEARNRLEYWLDEMSTGSGEDGAGKVSVATDGSKIDAPSVVNDRAD